MALAWTESVPNPKLNHHVKAPALNGCDKSIDFSKGATRARFETQKLSLGILVEPFDVPLSCSVNLVSY